MIKKISFLPEFIPMIKSGRKRVTRRIDCRLPGIYYFTAGRTGKKKGYIQIIEAWKRPLAESFYIDAIEVPTCGNNELFLKEIEMEGCDSLSEFIKIWESLTPKKYEWPRIKAETWEVVDPEIWRMEFRYLKDEPCWSVRDQIENNKLLEEHQKKVKDLACKVCVMLPISMEDALRFVILTDNGVDIMKIYDEYMKGRL